MKLRGLFAGLLAVVLLSACHKDDTNNPPADNPLADINNTYGYGLLDRAKGIWNGPVTSTTPLGGYTEWIVDFRPVSASQVSAKNELDTANDIHMSFFIAKYNNEYRLAFRNGGSFSNAKRISYFLADSVVEDNNHAYYRFSEIKKGKSRAYTEVTFTTDSLVMKSYTNKFNTLAAATLHMTWRAKLQETTSCQPAVTQFGFPQKVLSKDFSNSFTNVSEAVYYSLAGDPYPEAEQPYLGQSSISYTFANGFSPNAAKNVFLIITTQPLINGFNLNTGNLKNRSRYVILPSTKHNFTFNYMHPGTYYLYALYDNDGNKNFSSGDWVSTTNATFTLNATSTVNASTQINFTIP